MTPDADRRVVLSKALAFRLAELGLVRWDTSGPATAPLCAVVDGPDAPDRLVLVTTRPGNTSVESGYAMPGVQVIVRGLMDEPTQVSQDLAARIRSALDFAGSATWAAGTPHETWVFTSYADVPEPLWLGRDAAGRPRWSVAFTLEIMIPEAAA